MFRQQGDCSDDGITNGLCAMAGQCGAIFHTGDFAVTFHARQMQQNREARRSLDQRTDRGTSQAQDQVTLPVTGNRPIFGFPWPLADHDLRGDERLALPRSCARGIRNALPVRRHAVSSRRSAPRP